LKQLLTIELFGQDYTFNTDEDFAKAKEVADFLVKEVKRVEAVQQAETSVVNKTAVLILVALNIATENFELKRKQASFYRKITNRANDLIQILIGRASMPE
jgi:cell division protein ZapA